MKIYYEILKGLISKNWGTIELINYNDNSIVFRIKDKDNNKALLIVERNTFDFEYKRMDKRIIECIINLFEEHEGLKRI